MRNALGVGAIRLCNDRKKAANAAARKNAALAPPKQAYQRPRECAVQVAADLDAEHLGHRQIKAIVRLRLCISKYTAVKIINSVELVLVLIRIGPRLEDEHGIILEEAIEILIVN